MKKILSLMLVFMLILSSIASLQVVSAEDIPLGETQTVDCVAAVDTYVSSKIGETSKNFEGSPDGIQELWVSGVSSAKYSTYMVIDASDWQMSRIDSAKLQLFGLSVRKGSLNVYRIDDKMYDPSTVTYLKKPSETGKQLIGTVSLSAASYSWATLDVTSALNAEPDKILSLCIESTDATNLYKFASTENADPTYAPKLTITGAKPKDDILPESISLNRSTLSFVLDNDLNNGGTLGETLKASINPPYASNKNVTWTSSDESVATVVAGFVKPVNFGTAYITVTSVADPNLCAQCKVSVISLEEAGGVKSTKITSDDCYISEFPQGWPGNHGSSADLPLRSKSNSQSRQIYLKFKYPELSGYEILSAKVYMYCLGSTLDNLPVTPYGVFGNDTWSEMQVDEKDANRPESTISDNLKAYDKSMERVNDFNKWYSWNVTDYANEKANGIYTLKFYVDYNTPVINEVYLDSCSFSSKEGSFAPYMEIVARPYGVKNNATTGETQVYTRQFNPDARNSQTMVLMAANYKSNGVLDNVAANKIDVGPLSSGDLSVPMPVLNDQIGGYTKFLLWDDVKTALPLKLTQKYFDGGPEYVSDANPIANGISIDGKQLSIQGVTDKNVNIGYAIFKPGTYDTDLDYSNLKNSICQLDQKVTGSDGKYLFTYNIPDDLEEGIYTVVVSNGNKEDGNLVSPSTFKFIKTATESNLMQELTNANDTLSVEQILYPYVKTLNLDTSKLFTKYYYNMNKDIKDELLSQMMLKFDAPTDTVAYMVNEIIGLYEIKTMDNYSDMTDLMMDSMKELGISSSNISKLKSNQKLMRYVTQNTYGIEFGSLEGFDNKVNNLISNYKEPSPGTSGGGSSKGTTIKVAPTITTPTPAPTTKPIAVNPFKDLDNYGWAKDSIVKLAQKKIVEGTSTDAYSPADLVTREQFVKMLINAFGLGNDSDSCSFKDVDSNAWYYKYIATATKLGIVKGNEDNTFGIGQNISRQDMAVMTYRAANIAGKFIQEKNAASEFKDKDKIDSYALDAVTKMQKAGIITGLDDGTFNALGKADRAESAVIISRLLDN